VDLNMGSNPDTSTSAPEVRAVWNAELDLGEGPLWHAISGRYFFVDIHGCAVHAWNPATDQRQSWKTPERIGWLIPRADGDGFTAGLQSGFARLWLEPSLRIEAVGCPHPDQPDVRLNDAKADCRGRIWAGSMNNRAPSQPDGQLTRLDADGRFTVVERGIHIANGPAIAHDGSWMLHTDSWRNTVYRYRLGEDGQFSDKTVWRKFSEAEGTPDGMTMDAQGQVWIAFWGGACIRRFTPEAVLLQQIDLPALQITSMAFGGPQIDQLLVTSARNGMSAVQLAQYPQSGSVFVLEPGVSGVGPCTFG
jgi:sugar lactone lactonase YvrE